MSWKKWRIGLWIAIGCGVLTAGAGCAVGMKWQAGVAVLCTAVLTNLLNYLKTHPLEQVSDEPTNTNTNEKNP